MDIHNIKVQKGIKCAIFVLIAVLSLFVVSKYTTSPETYKTTINTLDEKKKTVMKLTAASAATSAAITLIPGDTATPIANKLADFSTYFIFVLSAIYLEKYLVTITAFVAFKVLIPVACGILAICMFWEKEVLRQVAYKMLALGVAIFLIIPASVKVSNMIENTYKSSIESTIENAENSAKEIEKSAKDADSEESKGLLDSLKNGLKSSISGVGDKVGGIINQFVEALAVLIVTSCLIPILVMVFFLWLIKTVLGIDKKSLLKRE